MKEANLDTHVLTVTCSLIKGGKCLEIVDDVFSSIFLDATLDVFLADIWSIGPDLGTRSAIDVLRTVTDHVVVTYVRPNKLMVGLETIDIMESEEASITTTSFACFRVDVIHHKGSGIKEVSNLHQIPPI